MKTLPELTLEITRYHEAIRDNPEDTKSKNKLDDRLKQWYNQLDITVFVANNEQLPYSSSELDFRTKPMLSKLECGFHQVGDYIFHIGNIGGKFADGFGGLIVERKTRADFYGTLFNTNKQTGRRNRDRFYDELTRFNNDKRFTDFRIFVECGIEEWLNYLPPNTKAKDLMINQKMGVLGSLDARGAHVVWCGNRKIAARLYRDFVKQWCIKNYARILGLDNGERVVKCFDND